MPTREPPTLFSALQNAKTATPVASTQGSHVEAGTAVSATDDERVTPTPLKSAGTSSQASNSE